MRQVIYQNAHHSRRRRRHKKTSGHKVFILLLIVVSLPYIYYRFSCFGDPFYDSTASESGVKFYSVIKQDHNDNYSGNGQKKVYFHDGYFTVFETEDNYKKTYKEYKQNGDSSWSDNSYWGGTMSENGCGITSLSIILSGYGKDYTPEDLRQKYYPVLDSANMSRELSSYGISNSDFYYDSSHMSGSSIENHLLTNRPVLICIWDKHGDNRWTNASHYMVLLAADGNGMIYVSNPNGLKNDSKSSGWYDINEITPYIAKVMYINEY